MHKYAGFAMGDGGARQNALWLCSSELAVNRHRFNRHLGVILRDSGQQCGINRVWRLMKRAGIKAQVG